MTSTIGYLLLVLAATPVMGTWMYRVYARGDIGRVEGAIYRVLRVDPHGGQTWQRYAASVLWFSVLSLVVLYLLQRLQGSLPLNPDAMEGVPPFVAFNAAASFVTNTNWQAYGGESTMSYLTQMAGLTVQNFVSAGVGMAVLVALIRGFSRHETDRIGNFWVDLTRSVVYILIPLAFVFALVLVAQGVVQTLEGAVPVTGPQGFDQLIARGPAASQVAIKQLGTNGGGFFNANSAHPFENPTQLSNLLQALAILLIPAGLCWTFGKMVGNLRQGIAVLAAMAILLVAGLAIAVPAERNATTAMRDAGVDPSQPNMEGKETRHGTDETAVWAVATTAASNGSVNGMHDSFTPLGAAAPIVNMATGEVIFGGVGSGLYGMLFYVILAVFIGGLMVGRTPEYLQKKIGSREVKLALVAVLVPFLLALGLAAVAVAVPSALDARLNAGPHGFSEILYAFLSQGNNNGSAFAGLDATDGLYSIGGGLAMLFSRFVPLLAALALAGSLARAKIVPTGAGTLRTDTGLFVGLLVGVIVIVAALTFLPVLVLGPVVEHLLGEGGSVFG